MSYQQTLDQMHEMGWHGAIEAYRVQQSNTAYHSMGFDERLGLITDAELNDRAQRREKRLLRGAKLKLPTACIEDLDYTKSRSLDRQVIASLTNCGWVDQGQHLIFTGPTGVGKTFAACAFGRQVIRMGKPVIYARTSRLLEELEIARADGRIPKLRLKLAKPAVLILDDWAMAPLQAQGRQDLLELIDDRTGRGSLILTSQLPVDQWHDYIGEPTLADAILDRILHRAHFVELQGESMRRRQPKGGAK